VAATAAFAVPAQAAIEVDHGIEFVNITGLDPNTPHTLTVSNPAGDPIGSKAFTSLADGSYEVNHIGAEEGDCFDGATSPDIREGDTLTVSDSTGPIDSYTVADVRYSARFDAATAVPAAPATMVVAGWARAAGTGTPIPAPELRLQRGPFAAQVNVVGGSLDLNRGNRLLITPDQDAAGAFSLSASPIEEGQVSEAILEVIEGANATSFSGDASFELPGCPPLDTTRGAVAAPPLPPPPAPQPGPGAGGGAAGGAVGGAAPQVITNTVIQTVPGAGSVNQGVLGTRAGSALRVSNLSLARRVSLTRLRLQGLRMSMRVPQGTNVLRIAVFKARNGQKTGSALLRTTRTPRAGLYRVTLRNASLLRKLRRGSYVVEVRAGRSAASLGSVRRITFTVTR
jgi:hypothetical protein